MQWFAYLVNVPEIVCIPISMFMLTVDSDDIVALCEGS